MYISKIHRRLVRSVAIVGLILTVFNKGLIAQQNELSLSSENYLDKTRNYYEMILETDSANYDALTNLGVIFQQMGDLEKSHSYFEKAVKFNP